MKYSVKALGINCLLIAFLMILPGWQADGRFGQLFPVSGEAMAADDLDDDEDPFGYEDDPFADTTVNAVSDPLEGMNRAFFKFNDKLYFWVLKPVSKVYATFIPTGVRISIRNAFTNILAPVRIVNSTLQGDLKGSGVELARFTINSTLGVGGMFDMAKSHFDLEAHDEDFGQTLGHYGLGPGIYINWPFFGPSTLRDSVGFGVDNFLDPLFYLPIDWYVYGAIYSGRTVNNTSLKLGEYEDFKKSALDPYVSMRNGYLQYRRKQIEK